jgi:hypothetical protein
MNVRRIIPNLNVDNASTGHEFYEDFFGLRKEFDMGWVASFRSPANPSLQVTLERRTGSRSCRAPCNDFEVMDRAEPTQVESVLADAAVASTWTLPVAHVCQSMLDCDALT